MNFKELINIIKNKKNTDLIKLENLYICEISLLSEYTITSLISFDYLFSSRAYIIAEKNKKEKYKDIFSNKKYKSENNLQPNVGEFFVTKTLKLNDTKKYISKEKLKKLLLQITNLEIIKKEKNLTENYLSYNCGNDEVCATCHSCGNLEYETELVNISDLPVCLKCCDKINKQKNKLYTPNMLIKSKK